MASTPAATAARKGTNSIDSITISSGLEHGKVHVAVDGGIAVTGEVFRRHKYAVRGIRMRTCDEGAHLRGNGGRILTE